MMAHGDERHRRIERVGRRHQQRVEVHEQVEAGARDEVTAIGQADQELVDRGGVVGAAQAIEPHQHGEPRSFGSVRPEIAGRGGPGVLLGGRRAGRLVVLAGARRQRPLGSGDLRAAVAGARRRLCLPLPVLGAAERQILDLFDVYARDLDLHGPDEAARAHGQTDDHGADVRQHREQEAEAPPRQHGPYRRAYPHSDARTGIPQPALTHEKPRKSRKNVVPRWGLVGSRRCLSSPDGVARGSICRAGRLSGRYRSRPVRRTRRPRASRQETAP